MSVLDRIKVNNTTYDIRDASAVLFGSSQSLTTVQKQRARENIGATDAATATALATRMTTAESDIDALEAGFQSSAVRADITQSFSTAQKTRARSNIGAADASDVSTLQAVVTTKAAASDVTALASRVTTAEDDIDALEAGAVYHNKSQSLTTAQQAQARTNIAAGAASDVAFLGTRMTTAESDIDALEAGAVYHNKSQSLTTSQKTQARSNIGAGAASDVTSLTTRVTTAEGDIDALEAGAVYHNKSQSLTDAQKTQARTNIAAGSASDVSALQTAVATKAAAADLTALAAAVVRHDAQTLTDAQKAQARTNISVPSVADHEDLADDFSEFKAGVTTEISDAASVEASALITITDGAALDVDSAIVIIKPVQSGSGDPSPENIRPISGWTGANVYHGADQTDYETISITFPAAAETVYGGTLDLTNGTLTVNKGCKIFDGTETLGAYSSGDNKLPRYSPSDCTTTTDAPCSSNLLRKATGYNDLLENAGTVRIVSNGIAIHMDGYQGSYDETNFKTMLAGLYTAGTPLTIVYPLATPVTYDIDPVAITLLQGLNTVWADCGDIALDYRAEKKDVFVHFDQAQALTSAQKEQARDNIESANAADVSALATRVTTAESDIDAVETAVATKASESDVAALTDRVTTAESDIDAVETAVAGKVAIAQGAGNAGKALVVGSDGNVTIGDAGVSDAVKTALLNIFQHTAYIDDDSLAYYNALYAALYPDVYPKIIATFNPGQNTIYVDEGLNALKQYLTVTYYETESSSGTTISGNDYTLSGTLQDGVNTIAVSYNNCFASFDVTAVDFYNQHTWSSNTGSLTKVSASVDPNQNDTTLYPSRVKIATPHNTRRHYCVLRGKAPYYMNNQTAVASQYYPIPVPESVNHMVFTMTPNSQYMYAHIVRYDSGTSQYSNSLKQYSWEQFVNGKIEYDIPSDVVNDGNLFLVINLKYDSAGTSYPVEPSSMTIEFSEVQS